MQTKQNPRKLLEDARYVASASDFNTAVSEMSGAEVLSIDTEFIRERTYFPQLCLIQVASQDQAWCLDAIAIEDLAPFMRLCEAPGVIKILHSARQDMEIFCLQADAVPMPIFDTQIAATFTGRADQISYAALVEEIFDIKLDKSLSRTNWLNRPLRPEQITYALNDVVYLNPMRDRLLTDLDATGRTEWFEEDSRELGNVDIYKVEPKEAWQKVKGGGHLSEPSFKCMMALAAWREEIAKRDDLPRSWVMKDPALLYIAENPHGDLSDYERHDALTSKQKRIWGDELREILDGDYQQLQLPRFHGTRGLDAGQKKIYKAISSCVKSVAIELDVPPSLLANRKQMEKIARGAFDTAVFDGWRNRIVGERIKALLDT